MSILLGTVSRTGKPLSPKTVNNIHGTLHKALALAKKLGYISKNPSDAEYVERPKVQPPDIKPFEDSDVTKLIKELSGNPYRNVILTMLFCGLREGEALGLSYDTIDFDNHTIRIVQQLQKNRLTKRYEIVTPKNGKSRLLCVSEVVIIRRLAMCSFRTLPLEKMDSNLSANMVGCGNAI